MLGEKVEIVYNENFYDGLIGTVIYEDESYVMVEVSIGTQFPQQVMFYKNQVKLYIEGVI
jgi:ribosomal protein L21E